VFKRAGWALGHGGVSDCFSGCVWTYFNESIGCKWGALNVDCSVCEIAGRARNGRVI
jgi:hypothetical protein